MLGGIPGDGLPAEATNDFPWIEDRPSASAAIHIRIKDVNYKNASMPSGHGFACYIRRHAALFVQGFVGSGMLSASGVLGSSNFRQSDYTNR
jgi:hypothetical protein